MPARKKRKTAKHKAHAKVKKVVRRKKTRRKVAAKSHHKIGVAHKRKSRKKRTVRRGQRVKVVHVVAGKKKRTRSRSHSSTLRRRRSYRRKPVVMAGRRRRAVGKKGNMGLLVGVGIGALLLYFMSRPKTVAYPNINQLPPLNATNNYQRNDQQNSILQYALAASLGIDAITKLIQSLNSSSDSQVQQIYDHVETTGTIPDTVYV